MVTRRTDRLATKRARKKAPKPIPPKHSSKKRVSSVVAAPLQQINADEIYTDEVIAKIAADFDIRDPKLITELRSVLIVAAKTYIAGLTHPTERGRLKNLKRTFHKLENTLCALDVMLAAMSDEERSRLWDDHWGEGEMPDFVYQQYPTIFIPKEFADEQAFLATLARLIARTGSMHDGLSRTKDVGGAPQDVALLDWVARLREFWINRLGRKFTYSAIRNALRSPAGSVQNETVPKSHAYKFCETAIKPLVPNIRRDALSTAVREVIKPLEVHRFVVQGGVKKEISQKPRPKLREVPARNSG